jgi:hypothetical protein
MSGISPQQKKNPKKQRKRKRTKDCKAKEVKTDLKSSMFQKEKTKRG